MADDKVRFAWSFVPVLPLHITPKINMINRAVLPLVVTVPTTDPSGGTERNTGFGDIIMANVFAPNKTAGFLYGIGPTWQFPSASSDFLGSGKVSVGPAAGAVWVGKEWILGLFPQQWWSIAGDSDRENVSFLDLQYFIWRLLLVAGRLVSPKT